MDESEGLEFFASELGCTIEPRTPRQTPPALMNYQRARPTDDRSDESTGKPQKEGADGRPTWRPTSGSKCREVGPGGRPARRGRGPDEHEEPGWRSGRRARVRPRLPIGEGRHLVSKPPPPPPPNIIAKRRCCCCAARSRSRRPLDCAGLPAGYVGAVHGRAVDEVVLLRVRPPGPPILREPIVWCAYLPAIWRIILSSAMPARPQGDVQLPSAARSVLQRMPAHVDRAGTGDVRRGAQRGRAPARRAARRAAPAP